MNEEELRDRADRILNIAMESKTPNEAIIVLCGALACYAARHAEDHEKVKENLHFLIDETYEGNKELILKEAANESNDVT
jgi:hypothetical protein